MAKIKTTLLNETINGIKVNTSLACHIGNFANLGSREVKYIVMHYTGNKKDTALNNAKYFMNNDVDVSAHFFVDDNSIYQSVELRDRAWHCGGKKYYHKYCRNSNSFGIEMCCTEGNYRIGAKAIENSAHLCARLCKLLGITADTVDTYVLRHYDVTHKDCPAQMAGSNNEVAEWIAFKDRVKAILRGDNSFTPYLVRVKVNTRLRIRAEATTNSKTVGYVTNGEVFTIVGEANGFGKLKSGLGWISLKYTEKL